MDDLGMLLVQMEWGADEALDDLPIDRLRTSPPGTAVALPPSTGVAFAPGTAVAGGPETSVAPRPASMRASGQPAANPVGTPAERALRAAAQATTLEELKAAIAGFEGCPLRDMATNIVFASGDPDAGLLLIGGPPGADEDRSGVPFSGPLGVLLDQMLASIGLKRDMMLLAPVIPWRPPGGRVPNPGELQLYRPFLMRLIALATPSRIVLFGGLAATMLLGVGHRVRSVGWTEAPVEGRSIPLMVLPALADLTRTPARRKDIWAGLRLLRRALDAQPG